MKAKNLGGRPKGTGADDRKELAAVADILVRNPDVRPTTAMKLVLRKAVGRHWRGADGGLRTLQRKWKEQGPQLLEEARHRLMDRRSVNAISRSSIALMDGIDAKRIAAISEAFSLQLNTPAMKRCREISEAFSLQVVTPEMKRRLAVVEGLQTAWGTSEMREVTEKLERVSRAMSGLHKQFNF